MSDQTHITADVDQEKVFEAHIVTRLTTFVTGQIDVKTYAKFGTGDRRLDAIQEETGA